MKPKTRQQQINRLADLAGVSPRATEAVLDAQALLVRDDLLTRRRATLHRLGRITVRGGRPSRAVTGPGEGSFRLPGPPRLSLQPGGALRVVRQILAEVFE